MSIDERLLEILACPQCKGAVRPAENALALNCERCNLKFPVRDGIPVMIIEEALDSKTGLGASGTGSVKLSKASFRVTQGPDSKMMFHLEQGTCRALGRGSVDPMQTTVFNVDLTLALDEGTKRLIQQYVSKQFKKASGEPAAASDRIGQFRRAPDIVLTDASLSRLHAMIFYHESGIAILDLVSKNGTFVNGQEIESRILKNGDTIELGETTIEFEG